MTSVGYGDILPFNNVERAYCIVLEFIGAIIFAMVRSTLFATFHLNRILYWNCSSLYLFS
jgi:hypothetical protein